MLILKEFPAFFLYGEVSRGQTFLPHFLTWSLLPGADGHLVGVVDERTAVAAVTLPEAVVVHAVLPLRLLLPSVSDDGETSLDCTAGVRKTNDRGTDT